MKAKSVIIITLVVVVIALASSYCFACAIKYTWKSVKVYSNNSIALTFDANSGKWKGNGHYEVLGVWKQEQNGIILNENFNADSQYTWYVGLYSTVTKFTENEPAPNNSTVHWSLDSLTAGFATKMVLQEWASPHLLDSENAPLRWTLRLLLPPRLARCQHN